MAIEINENYERIYDNFSIHFEDLLMNDYEEEWLCVYFCDDYNLNSANQSFKKNKDIFSQKD